VLICATLFVLFNGAAWLDLWSSSPSSSSHTPSPLAPEAKKGWDGTWESRFRPLSEDDIFCLDQGIILTREYQTKLHRRDIMGPRSDKLTQLLEKIEGIMQIPGIGDLTQGRETIRYQYTMDTTSCGKGYNPRGRDYVTGYRAGTSTFDVKSSTTGQEEPSTLMHKDWSSFPEWQEGKMHKFEWDVHPCKIKYSVESRINIPYRHRFQTCGDLRKVYRRMADGIKPSRSDNKLGILELYSGWWYELEHTGILSDGVTKYKTACTIQYPSFEEALVGKKPINIPEWSIRLWGSHEGTGPFVESTIDQINERYSELLVALENEELPCQVEFKEHL